MKSMRSELGHLLVRSLALLTHLQPTAYFARAIFFAHSLAHSARLLTPKLMT